MCELSVNGGVNGFLCVGVPSVGRACVRARVSVWACVCPRGYASVCLCCVCVCVCVCVCLSLTLASWERMGGENGRQPALPEREFLSQRVSLLSRYGTWALRFVVFGGVNGCVWCEWACA